MCQYILSMVSWSIRALNDIGWRKRKGGGGRNEGNDNTIEAWGEKHERGNQAVVSLLQIYNNGYVSLGSGTTGGYTPRPFPFRGAPMIAPYWADVDTRVGSGRVYYRESASSSDRTRVSSIIRTTYHTNFMPSRVFIVQWNRVGYYSRHQNRVS